MDKKKLFKIILIIIAIILLILLLFRSCASQNEKTAATDEEIYSAFIKASTQFSCDIQKDPTLSTEEHITEVYREFKLPVDDDQAMMDILKKYENDNVTLGIIQENSKNCSTE